MVRLRWPEGFRCPVCGGAKGVVVRSTLFQCTACRRQTSVTAGTVFQDTRKPLTMWFRAMWYVTSQKNGASALGVKRVLGLGSYQTAWAWLHKLRRAMVRPGRERLSGWIEVDETYLGGLEEGVAGRETERKALIVIAAEADGPGIGRLRMRVIPDASAASLHSFVEDSIETGSTLHTDGWQGYSGLERKGYQRELTVLRGRRKDASKLLPRVHRVVSLLRRWLSGHPPRRGGARTPAVLPRRVHVSLQSPEVDEPRQAFLSLDAASCQHRANHLRDDDPAPQTPARADTTCWG